MWDAIESRPWPMRKWILILVLALGAAGAAVYLTIGHEGESGIEAWLGRELKRIVNDGGHFSLEFSAIDYQRPDRVVLEDMRLSLANSNGELAPLVEIRRGAIELAEFPRMGKPIVLKTVDLLNPVVRVESLIAAARRPDNKLGSTTKRSFSSILTLRRVDIENGEIRYDDGTGSPLSWTKLNARLDLESADQQWHRAHMVIDQSPLMKADIATELGIDTFVARNIDVKAMLDLNDPAALQFFTPPLQRMLTTSEVRGRAELSLTGNVDGKELRNTNATLSFQLADANVSAGEYQFPIARIDAVASFRDSTLSIDPVEISALGGRFSSRARIALDETQEVTGQAIASSVNLQDLLRAKTENSKSELAGLVSADIRVSTKRNDMRRVLDGSSDGLRWGSGYVNLTKGRLVRLPVIEQLMFATREVTGVFTGAGQNNDTLEAHFLLIDQVFDVGSLLYRGDGLGVRGKGRISMNGEIDFAVNAGPLEWLQDSLGAIGQAWGKLTDRLMGYSVKGTVKEPTVRPMIGSR